MDLLLPEEQNHASGISASPGSSGGGPSGGTSGPGGSRVELKGGPGSGNKIIWRLPEEYVVRESASGIITIAFFRVKGKSAGGPSADGKNPGNQMISPDSIPAITLRQSFDEKIEVLGIEIS